MASVAPTLPSAPRPTPHPQLLLIPRRVGNYLVAVTLNGEPILGSRFALSVTGAGADATSCVAAGTGLRRMVAGELGRFTVQAWDAYGNIVRRRTFEWRAAARAPAACAWGVAPALLSSHTHPPTSPPPPHSPPLTPFSPSRVAGGAEAARLPGASTAGLSHLQRPVRRSPSVADPAAAQLGQQPP